MKTAILMLLLAFQFLQLNAKAFPLVSSPGKKLRLQVYQNHKFFYQLYYLDQLIVDSSFINMVLSNAKEPASPDDYSKTSTRSIDELIGSPIDQFHTSFEEPCQYHSIDKIPGSSLFFNPVLLASERGPKIAITESDLEEYPGMFLKAANRHHLYGAFAPYPAVESFIKGEYPQRVISKREKCIAKTSGTSNFPWRIRYDSDYKLYSKEVSPKNTIMINMQSGGGYMVRFFKK